MAPSIQSADSATTTKKSKPNFRLSSLPISKYSADDVFWERSTLVLLPYSNQVCLWEGCTSHGSRHVHVYPDELTPGYCCVDEEDDGPSCPFEGCGSKEPHRHHHSYSTQELWKDYKDQQIRLHARGMNEISQLQNHKSEQQLAAEMEEAKKICRHDRDKNPYEASKGWETLFDIELNRVWAFHDMALEEERQAAERLARCSALSRAWRSTVSSRQKIKVRESYPGPENVSVCASTQVKSRGGWDADEEIDQNAKRESTMRDDSISSSESDQMTKWERKKFLIKSAGAFVERRDMGSDPVTKWERKQYLVKCVSAFIARREEKAYAKHGKLTSLSELDQPQISPPPATHRDDVDVSAMASILPQDPCEAGSASERMLVYIDGVLAMYRSEMMLKETALVSQY
ncbi:MAG: hypothetical protein Q9191_002732 [Dirinaria sp. TL-2023a]